MPFHLFSQNDNEKLPKNGLYEQCLTEAMHEKRLLNDNMYRNSFIKSKKLSNKNNISYTIPIVVHVMHLGEEIGVGTNISDEQISSAIVRINEQYGSENSGVNTNITFCLANVNPQGEYTNGINRVDASNISDYSINGITNNTGSSENEETIKSLSNWSNLDYYNVWIVSEIDGNDGGSGTQGYAYYANAGSYQNNFDGAVILYNSFGYDPSMKLGYNLKSYTNLNVTFAHEMGHAFNLKHTFEGDEGGTSCPSNTNCFTSGDEVCDTDPHSRDDGNCDDLGETCYGVGTDLSDIVTNIMSYSSQICKTKFTNGQSERMTVGIADYRSSLLESNVCLQPVFGCTDIEACNYNLIANNDDGSCEYLDGICESCEEGLIIDNDIDNDGICDDDEIETFSCILDDCIDLGDNAGEFSSLSECIDVCNTSSINQIETSLKIYPNPSTGIFKLELFSKRLTSIKAFDILGKMVFHKKTEPKSEQLIQLDFSNIPKGIYNLCVEIDNLIYNHRVILQ